MQALLMLSSPAFPAEFHLLFKAVRRAQCTAQVPPEQADWGLDRRTRSKWSHLSSAMANRDEVCEVGASFASAVWLEGAEHRRESWRQAASNFQMLLFDACLRCKAQQLTTAWQRHGCTARTWAPPPNIDEPAVQCPKKNCAAFEVGEHGQGNTGVQQQQVHLPAAVVPPQHAAVSAHRLYVCQRTWQHAANQLGCD